MVATSETDILAWDLNPTVDINHINSVTPGSAKLLFLALGIEFYQEVHERMYFLNNGSYYPLVLAQVSGLQDDFRA
ncbi:MAG: hypothetical protein ACI9L6_001167 [Flavobacterium sp.]